jgi:hypothetical protein
MSGFGSGTQSEWYAAGMLLMQLAFLVGGMWFASNFLKTIRGFQEQVGALVKLSVTGAPAEQREATTIARQTLGEGSFTWELPAKNDSVRVTGTVERGGNRVWGGSERFSSFEVPVVRVSEPAVTVRTETSDENRSGNWGRIGSWLRTPMKAQLANPEATGLRRMMQWLGAPAGS